MRTAAGSRVGGEETRQTFVWRAGDRNPYPMFFIPTTSDIIQTRINLIYKHLYKYLIIFPTIRNRYLCRYANTMNPSWLNYSSKSLCRCPIWQIRSILNKFPFLLLWVGLASIKMLLVDNWRYLVWMISSEIPPSSTSHSPSPSTSDIHSRRVFCLLSIAYYCCVLRILATLA